MRRMNWYDYEVDEEVLKLFQDYACSKGKWLYPFVQYICWEMDKLNLSNSESTVELDSKLKEIVFQDSLDDEVGLFKHLTNHIYGKDIEYADGEYILARNLLGVTWITRFNLNAANVIRTFLKDEDAASRVLHYKDRGVYFEQIVIYALCGKDALLGFLEGKETKQVAKRKEDTKEEYAFTVTFRK